MKKFLSTGIAIVALTGCATHSVMRGSVAMKVNDTEAHVCMNKDEIKAGDHLVLYKNVCEQVDKGKDRTSAVCKKVESGHGEITQILNDHYSAVKFPAGTKFSEGDIVEKHTH